MNNLSNERLKEIIEYQPGGENYATRAEWMEMARELLAYREAKEEPVAWLITPKRIAKPFTTNSKATALRNERMGKSIVPLYTAPPLPAVIGWINEDELPEHYPYEQMFPFSKVDIVRIFPVYAPQLSATNQKPKSELLQRAERLAAETTELACRISSAPVTPSNWVAVPIVPTEDMIIEGFESEPDETFSEDKCGKPTRL